MRGTCDDSLTSSYSSDIEIIFDCLIDANIKKEKRALFLQNF